MVSLRLALQESGMANLAGELATLVPDLNAQYSRTRERGQAWNLRQRGLHAFQVKMMLRALQHGSSRKVKVVDIGDSAGTHMLYLKGISQGLLQADTLSVNLDPQAIAKIKSKGLEAILCRAEDLDLSGQAIDLFTSTAQRFFFIGWQRDRLARESSLRFLL